MNQSIYVYNTVQAPQQESNSAVRERKWFLLRASFLIQNRATYIFIHTQLFGSGPD